VARVAGEQRGGEGERKGDEEGRGRRPARSLAQAQGMLVYEWKGPKDVAHELQWCMHCPPSITSRDD